MPMRAWQAVLSGALLALGFFLPFSTAGTSLALAVLLALLLARPQAAWALAPWREPVLACGLLLLAYIALRTLLGEGARAAASGAVNRYHELLMIPLLWALLRLSERPQRLMQGLLAGAFAFAVLHWVALASPAVAAWLLPRRISAGFGLALCAFLFFEHARLGALPRRPAQAAALFLAATVLFTIGGRTGHVVLFVLVGCAAWRAAPARWRGAAVLVVLLAGAVAASLSSVVQQRADETLAALQADEKGLFHNSPTGIRIELLRNGVAVAREHWLLGSGWDAYPQAFHRAATARHGTAPVPGTYSDNPHNEYLLQSGAGGVPALLLFLAWLAAPMRRAWRTAGQEPWLGALGCVALAFAVGCLFNSLLLDFVEGHLYAAVLAWLLAHQRPAA